MRRAAGASIVVVILFVLAEAASRVAFGSAPIAPAVFQSSPLAPGYKLLPGSAVDWRFHDRLVHTSINDGGYRTTTGAGSARGQVVHLIGDSQVFGWGLGDHETIASQLQLMLGSNAFVVNHGVPGYGPFEYAATLRNIDPSEWVVTIFSEENDLWDSYRIYHNANVECGYLSTGFALRFIPCLALDLSLMQFGMDEHNQFRYGRRPTPIGFDDQSIVAAKVLSARIFDLFKPERARRDGRLIVGVVPWVAKFASAELVRYYPPPKSVPAAHFVADDMDVESWFLQSQLRDQLYFSGDAHLSPAGSRQFALRIAQVLQSRGFFQVGKVDR